MVPPFDKAPRDAPEQAALKVSYEAAYRLSSGACVLRPDGWTPEGEPFITRATLGLG